MIRIVHAVTGLGVGGAERVVIDLVRERSSMEFEASIATFTKDLRIFDTAGRPDVDVHVFDMKSGSGRWFTALLAFRRHLREVRPDVLHAHMFHGLLFSLLGVAGQRRRPAIIFTSHSAQMTSGLRRLLVWATRGARAADIVFGASQHGELNARRTRVIPNGVAIAENAPARRPRALHEPLRFLFVGRLSRVKRVPELVDAFADAELPSATLDIIGEGEERALVVERVAARGLQGRVNLRGLQSDVRERLREADALLLYSSREGLPMVVLEAGAEAVPVIAPPVGSLPSLLADDRGYIAREEAFSDVLRLVAEEPAKARAVGENLRNYVKAHCSTQAMLAAHEELYRAVAAARRWQPPVHTVKS